MEPFATPQNRNVPTLATMAEGAIHCLEGDPNGFYLMIEGGAVDWANHQNVAGRTDIFKVMKDAVMATAK
jgi:alkaline phosphatase